MADNIEYSIKLTDGFTLYAHSELILAVHYAETKNRAAWGKLNDISKGHFVEQAVKMIQSTPAELVTENGQETFQRVEPTEQTA